jgi:hypothetical protein
VSRKLAAATIYRGAMRRLEINHSSLLVWALVTVAAVLYGVLLPAAALAAL